MGGGKGIALEEELDPVLSVGVNPLFEKCQFRFSINLIIVTYNAKLSASSSFSLIALISAARSDSS